MFDRVVEGDVGVGEVVEPVFGHLAFGAVAVVGFELGHGEGFDVEGGVAEGAFADEADEVPVDEEEVESGGVGDEDGFAGEGFEPGDVAAHGGFGGFEVRSADGPGGGLGGPPFGGFGVGGGSVEGFEVGGEGGDELFVGGVGGGAEAEHGVGAGDGAVGFDVGADVDFGHGWGDLWVDVLILPTIFRSGDDRSFIGRSRQQEVEFANGPGQPPQTTIIILPKCLARLLLQDCYATRFRWRLEALILQLL